MSWCRRIRPRVLDGRGYVQGSGAFMRYGAGFHSKLPADDSGCKLSVMVPQRRTWPFNVRKTTINLPADVRLSLVCICNSSTVLRARCNEAWVDERTPTMASSPNRRLALAVDVVLRATFVHEIVHWILTLIVSKLFLAEPRYIYEKQSVGHHSQDYNQRTVESSSSQVVEDWSAAKSMQAEWTGSCGEAGNHVKLKAGGGIAVFHTSRDDVMFSSSLFLIQSSLYSD
jgi:hypothetical protein